MYRSFTSVLFTLILFLSSCATSNYQYLKRFPAGKKTVKSCFIAVEHFILKRDAQSSEAKEQLKNLWKLDKSFEIVPNKFITYAFDSELPHSDVYRLISSNPAMLEDLQEALDNSGKSLRFDIQELSKIFKRSEKQLKAFSIRRKSLGKQEYQITDLNPVEFNIILHHLLTEVTRSSERIKLDANLESVVPFNMEGALNFLNNYKTILNDIFHGQHDFKVGAHLDQQWIELIHDSSEVSPLLFKKIMDSIHATFKDAASHFHVGIPADIGEAKGLSIARAVESRIILFRAMESENPEKLYATTYTTLTFNPMNSGKSAGVIRYNSKKWDSPWMAHDLEIREGTVSERFDNAAFATVLAKNHDSLKFFTPYHQGVKYNDKQTSNLRGALEYVGRILKSNSDKKLKEIGSNLEALSKKCHFEISEKDRELIYDYLNEVEIDEILDDYRIFLE
ncbi:MAG: hypothetical protein KAQ98_00220 [Bacteriovoracaceae bacterium]|nr:hypothetical protein [Bacteriovoracaceae bacterium]